MFNYQEFIDSIDPVAYHKGELQWEEDGYTVHRTYNYTAPGCHNSCGVLYYTKDGKLEKVEGDPYDPYSNGHLCMRCLNMEEAVNHPDRVKYPMKRAGERGENKWERISWEEALDLIESEIKKMEDAGYGRESIMVNHGTGRNINWQVPFLASACLRTPNVGALYYSGSACYVPRICGTAAHMGDYPIPDCSEIHEDRYSNPEWKCPEVMVVWGVEPLKSNADGFMGHWMNVCHQLGAKIISIDPQLTWWGARAEYWLPIRPGTDTALALAWLNVICGEDLIDHEFVDYWCAYYEELVEHVKEFTPEWASEVCGVPAEDITASARLYANANPGTIQWGLTVDTQITAMEAGLAMADLMAICGNIDVPGGINLVRNAFKLNAGYGTAQLYVPPERWENRLSCSVVGDAKGQEFLSMASADAMAMAMESGKPYPLKICWIQSSNALSCSGLAAPRAYEGIRNSYDFVVVADPFITPTAVACADLILPIAMSCERDSIRTGWWTPVRAMRKVVDRYYESVTDEELIVMLGLRLNPELFEKRWPTVEAFLDDCIATDLAVIDEERGVVMKGDVGRMAKVEELDENSTIETGNKFTWKELAEDELGFKYDEWNSTYRKYEKGMLREDGQIGFNTMSGRVELVPPLYSIWGIDPKVRHRECAMMDRWLSDEEFRTEYPFVFINGARSYEFFHSEHRQLQTMREFHPDPIVKISPETAEEYGLEDGDWIWMENPDGRCKQKVQVFPGIDKRFISAEHGWWFPETEGAEPNLFGTFDSNPNNLTHINETGSGGAGAPIKTLCCKIYKVEEGDILPGEQVTRLGGFRKYKVREH